MKKMMVALFIVVFTLLAGAALAEENGAPVQMAQVAQPSPAPAPEQAPPAKIDTGDTAWLLTSSALVLLMTPGLALFYAGMVRRKNVLATLMHSFVAMGIITIQWVLFGYSLAFGPDVGHFIGNLDWIGLSGVGFAPNPDYGATVPHQAYMIFQMMFAIITPALISGAIAERIKFSAYCVFLIAWATLVYDPLAHWVWGTGGWLGSKLGALDFAGGLVVHISSGVSALACALVLGRRKGYQVDIMAPHNLTLTILGASLLWFGWFGFNAGSAVKSGELSTSAFVVTHIATAVAAMSWMVTEWIHRGKPTALGAASGAVAGLVAITPASGFIGPLPAFLLGIFAGAICYGAVSLKPRFGYDDSLDVVGVHGIGGTLGALFTGFFASKLINPAGADGLFFGNPSQVGVQALSVVSAWVYSFVVTLIILKVIDAIIGLRVSEEDESTGLDLSQHGEVGYTFEA
jgi:Amt family ammonium transporter